MVQRVAMEASDLVAAKAADQSPTTFRVFITFNDDKMTPSGMNTHHTPTVCVLHAWRSTCGGDVIVGGVR